MMKLIKNLFNPDRAGLYWFYVAIILSTLVWLFLAFDKGPRLAKLPPPEVSPIVSFDQASFKITKQYLDSIDNYRLPITTPAVNNLEPFREYK